MSSIENVSIFIPHVFPNFDEEYIVKNFEQYGNIDRVDFVAKQDRNGKDFNSVYVHFKFWLDTPENRGFQTHLLDDSVETHIYHDDTRWYWIALPNISKKHVSGDRKPRIDIGDAKSINSSSITPEKLVLKRSETIRGPPKKPYVADEDPLAGFAGWLNFQPEETQTQYKLPPAKCISDYYNIDPDEDAMRMEEIEKEWANEDTEEWTMEEWAKVCEDTTMMEELEDGWPDDDAYLVSIDGRYLQELEGENMWLRNEVTQLRAAVVNLNYMYQVESAKVRGLDVECKKNV